MGSGFLSWALGVRRQAPGSGLWASGPQACSNMGIGAISSFSLRQKVRRHAYARVNHMSGTFRDLESWQKAFDLALAVYSATRAFPKEETYGLTIQLRRAAVSVVSNIAEGKGRTP